jgi:hypothetical protein
MPVGASVAPAFAFTVSGFLRAVKLRQGFGAQSISRLCGQAMVF